MTNTDIETTKKLVKFFNKRKIIINNSEARIKHKNPLYSPWLDNGDYLKIEFKDYQITSISIHRDEEKINFIIPKNIKMSCKVVSTHFLAIEIKELEIFGEQKKYDMEIIAQCNCAINKNSNKDKVIFYFSESNHICKHNHCLHTDTSSSSGAGGGWAEKPLT